MCSLRGHAKFRMRLKRALDNVRAPLPRPALASIPAPAEDPTLGAAILSTTRPSVANFDQLLTRLRCTVGQRNDAQSTDQMTTPVCRRKSQQSMHIAQLVHLNQHDGVDRRQLHGMADDQ